MEVDLTPSEEQRLLLDSLTAFNMVRGLDVIEIRDILHFGDEAQRGAVLSEMSAGREPFALCITEPGAGSDNAGISQRRLNKVGWWTIDSSEIRFDDVVVDESTLVGIKGEGSFDDDAAYAGQRVAFGQAIGNFQLIQEKLTDMKAAIENMRSLTYRGAAQIDAGEDPKMMAAMAKRYCPQKASWVADEAMQIFGGVGYTTGTRVARIWRDLRGFRFGGGTDEIMVHIVGPPDRQGLPEEVAASPGSPRGGRSFARSRGARLATSNPNSSRRDIR